jgi:hypothetical protein
MQKVKGATFNSAIQEISGKAVNLHELAAA